MYEYNNHYMLEEGQSEEQMSPTSEAESETEPTTMCGLVTVKKAAIFCGVFGFFGSIFFAIFFVATVSGHCYNDKGKKITPPEYAKITSAIFAAMFFLQAIFCCLLVYGVLNQIRVYLRLFGALKMLTVTLLFLNLLAEYGYIKQMEKLGLSLTMPLVVTIVYAVLSVAMIFIVNMECNQIKKLDENP